MDSSLLAMQQVSTIEQYKTAFIKLHESYGIQVFQKKWLGEHDCAKAYQFGIKNGCTPKQAAEALGVLSELTTYIQQQRQKWTMQKVTAVLKDLIATHGDIPTYDWLNANQLGGLCKFLGKNGGVKAFRTDLGATATQHVSRGGLILHSWAETSLANWLWIRNIQVYLGRKYPSEYVEFAGHTGSYVMEFDGTHGIYNKQRILIEVWGNANEDPVEQISNKYIETKNKKLEFNKNNPNFLEISSADCYKEERLQELLGPYVGQPESNRLAKEEDMGAPAALLSSADNVLEACPKNGDTKYTGERKPTLQDNIDLRQIRTGRAASGEEYLVSACDYECVMQYEWHMWSEYLRSGELSMALHHFIIGPRPSDVPEDYVVDHANRNRLDATRDNLRYVSPSFNAWNKAKQLDATSKFVGVSYDKERGKWRANCAAKQLGRHSDERDAAKAVAKEAVSHWGLWAAQSDLLIGPGLLTVEEIRTIQTALNEDVTFPPIKEARSLPRGVIQNKGMHLYTAIYGGKRLGNFVTVPEAEAAYIKYVKGLREEKWNNHLKTPIFKDADGHAAILLTGKYSHSHSAKCPEHLWHQLTFETTWWYDGIYAMGQWQGEKQKMHRVVVKLCNPDWDGKLQVDHKVPENTLDNRECNLRIATRSLQAYNKSKRQGTTCDYIGVRHVKGGKWAAQMEKDGQVYNLGYKFTTPHDAARAINAKALELWGKDARVMTILDKQQEDIELPSSSFSLDD